MKALISNCAHVLFDQVAGTVFGTQNMSRENSKLIFTPLMMSFLKQMGLFKDEILVEDEAAHGNCTVTSNRVLRHMA